MTLIETDSFVDERDREYMLAQTDPAVQEAVFCAVSTYRQPSRLQVGDATPALTLTHLQTGDLVELGGPRQRLDVNSPTRPLLLFFGSYT